mmetsp:Transcript_27917/g.57371  ORF Transcript_27917/g.57371 Transcript_27917/m.57371 type:complete len:130 (-) Transcript_27917:1291-1680(-)
MTIPSIYPPSTFFHSSFTIPSNQLSLILSWLLCHHHIIKSKRNPPPNNPPRHFQTLLLQSIQHLPHLLRHSLTRKKSQLTPRHIDLPNHGGMIIPYRIRPSLQDLQSRPLDMSLDPIQWKFAIASMIRQ